MCDLLSEHNKIPQIRSVILLLVMLVFSPNELLSQEARKNKMDTLSQDLKSLDTIDDSKGVLKKILRLFKFKENKERKEKEKIQSYLEELNQKNPNRILDLSNGSILLCRQSNFNPSSVPLDSIIQNDAIYYYRKCLQPKIKIIGNYAFNEQESVQDYNFDYLSTLNYEEYELAPSGESKTPEILSNFSSSSILNEAILTGCDIYLTVQNNNPTEISSFLHDPIAQKKFRLKLTRLLNLDELKGININFQGISTTDNTYFIKFIENLCRLNLSSGTPLEIVITIPLIEDTVSVDKTKAYDFNQLNQFVDYYLVRTENSMLYEDSNTTEGLGTIESTMDFYTSRLIPSSKLIATVSWSGRDNPKYLMQKYNWVLENSLGGIFIRDIDGTSNNVVLWKNVRTELMEIGATLVKKKVIELEKGTSLSIIISIVFLIFIFFFWQYYKRSQNGKLKT